MTAEMPPIGRHSPSTIDSNGSIVVLALASPSSSMTWTCSRSRRAFWAGSKFFSQSEMLPPKAATPRRVSASMSPSRYLRSSIILRLSRVRPDSTGRSWPRSLAVLPLRGSPALDKIGHPPAPLGVFSLVADAAPERGVGSELGAVGRSEILQPLPYLLVVRELLLVP